MIPARRKLPGSVFLPNTTERSLRQAIIDMYLLLRQAFVDFAPDPAQSSLAPTENEVVRANTSAVVVRTFTIPSGVKFTIESGARFMIL